MEAQRFPIRVVIADEQPLFAKTLESILGYDDRIEVVARARDGREAVELAAAHSPDVVLMDIAMPVMDGFEATRRIRATAPSVKVLMLSGSDSRADVVRAQQAGAERFVPKKRVGPELVDAILALAGAAAADDG